MAVPLPGKSHGWKSLVGQSPWGRKELDTTERFHFHFTINNQIEMFKTVVLCLTVLSSYLETVRSKPKVLSFQLPFHLSVLKITLSGQMDGFSFLFLKTVLLEEFQVHSKIKRKLQIFFLCPLVPTNAQSPPYQYPPPEWYICYSS